VNATLLDQLRLQETLHPGARSDSKRIDPPGSPRVAGFFLSALAGFTWNRNNPG
jgi:hypothetical protein